MRAVLQQALDALEHSPWKNWRTDKSITAIKQALAEPTKPLTGEEKLDIVTNWFAEDWAIKKAIGMLSDYEAKLKEKNT